MIKDRRLRISATFAWFLAAFMICIGFSGCSSDIPDKQAGEKAELYKIEETALALPGHYRTRRGAYRTTPFPPPDQKKMDDLWQALLKMAQEERVKQEAVAKKAADEAGLELGPWYCVGPFKDKLIGNFREEFRTVYGPEKQALAAGANLIDLDRAWEVKKLPGILETTRPWMKHPEWEDGYFHQLPMGPPPAYNETVYLYRTITAKKNVSVDMDLHAEYALKAWINGKEIGEAYPTRIQTSNTSTRTTTLPASLKTLNLKEGKNRMLVKITCVRGTRGFAFAIPLITPYNTDYPPNKPLESVNRFYPGNEPFASSANTDPAEIEARYINYHERKDGVLYTGFYEQLTLSYMRTMFRLLSLPEEASSLLPLENATYFGRVPIVRELYYRACKYTDAVERVRGFQFDVPIAEMYDPPILEMDKVLEETVSPSPGGQAYLDRLAVLKRKAQSALNLVDQAAPGATEAIIEASEDIEKMWSDEIGSLEPIVFIKRPAYWINAVAPYSADGASPGSICFFDPSRPGDPPRVIYHDPDGAIFDMNISYDAKTIFFSARRNSLENYWHIYEIGVNGKGLKQITHGDSDNISPVLLPNGEVMFVSTRKDTYMGCQPEVAGNLYVANRDGSNVRLVSANTHSDHTPQVMNDGRVLFSHWDYGVDKGVYCRQQLWIMNPDGTNLQLFSGNTTRDPNAFWEARPIPNRPEVVCVFGPHHFYQAGMIGLVWNRLGLEAPRGQGYRWVTQEIQLVQDIELPWGYQDPFPINERQFLVSYGGDGQVKNRIYLLDDRGNRKCIYEDLWQGCWDPILLRPHKKPVIAPASKSTEHVYRDPARENMDPNFQWGTFFVQDVYEGLLPHVNRGEIKSLAIMEQLDKPCLSFRGQFGDQQPVIGRGTFFVRRLIGTVPVEADGSAHFKAPAVKDISFNALDSEGRVLMKMGSTTQIMPGEVLGCVGCHESRFMAPPPSTKKGMPIAAQREPTIPEFPDWGTDGIVDFVKVVQPVLDKYCVKCHSGPNPAATVDLSNDKTRFFNMGYDQLVDRGMVDYIIQNPADHEENTPNGNGSIVSRIRQFIETDHSGQVVPLKDRQRIYTWIDSNVPYYGTYNFTNGIRMGGRGRWYNYEGHQWFREDYAQVFQKRCFDCHKHTIPGVRRGKVVTSKIWDNEYSIRSAGGIYEPVHRINLTHPEWSLALTAPLAKEAGGLGLCQDKDGTPYIFKDKNDPDYKTMLMVFKKLNEGLLAEPRADMIDLKLLLTKK